MAINLAQYDHIVSHSDGNNNDTDDIGALPVAAALLDAADLEDKKFVRLSGSDPYRSTLDIDGTTDDPLFQSERLVKRLIVIFQSPMVNTL